MTPGPVVSVTGVANKVRWKVWLLIGLGIALTVGVVLAVRRGLGGANS